MDRDDIERRRAEVAGKLAQVRKLLLRRNVDAMYLTSTASTAWLTAGAATYVDESVDAAACALLVTPEQAIVLTDGIEEPRLRAEERLDALGFTFVVEPWHSRGYALRRHVAGLLVGVETPTSLRGAIDLSADLVTLRSRLTLDEQERLREGGRRAADAMWEAAHAVTPGMTEYEAAALLAAASRKRGGTATVTLVGSDERIFHYRHSLPTAKAIERYVMLILCFRFQGLVTALTRSVYFGETPDALRHLATVVARIDAQVIAGTRPGRTLGDMFSEFQQAYAREGVGGAIEEHHQGGTIAYLGRETLARPGSLTCIETGQAFAWNPSVFGAKSEDTMLLTEHGPAIITAMDGWPTLAVETEAGIIARPAILEISKG